MKDVKYPEEIKSDHIDRQVRAFDASKPKEAEDTIAALRQGNSELLDALMSMCCQYLGDVDNSNICSHMFMSAGEAAMDVLCRAGMAKEVDGGSFELLWDALQQRNV